MVERASTPGADMDATGTLTMGVPARAGDIERKAYLLSGGSEYVSVVNLGSSRSAIRKDGGPGGPGGFVILCDTISSFGA